MPTSTESFFFFGNYYKAVVGLECVCMFRVAFHVVTPFILRSLLSDGLLLNNVQVSRVYLSLCSNGSSSVS
jgi:hypothetical protein